MKFIDWLEDAEEEPGVYFVRVGDWVKIGMSSLSVKDRVESLGFPPNAQFITAFYTLDPRGLEKAIHDKGYWARCWRTEWFEMDDRTLKDFIDRIEYSKGFEAWL